MTIDTKYNLKKFFMELYRPVIVEGNNMNKISKILMIQYNIFQHLKNIITILISIFQQRTEKEEQQKIKKQELVQFLTQIKRT